MKLCDVSSHTKLGGFTHRQVWEFCGFWGLYFRLVFDHFFLSKKVIFLLFVKFHGHRWLRLNAGQHFVHDYACAGTPITGGTCISATALHDCPCWPAVPGNTYARTGTPWVQFANIRKVVLCQDLPHCLQLLVDLVWYVMPKVLIQVYIRDRKIWKLFLNIRRNKTKCDQFFCPTSDFFDFCNTCFFYHVPLPVIWILLTKHMVRSEFHRFTSPTSSHASLFCGYLHCAHKYLEHSKFVWKTSIGTADVGRCTAMKSECTIMQKSVTTVCLHCSLAILKN